MLMIISNNNHRRKVRRFEFDVINDVEVFFLNKKKDQTFIVEIFLILEEILLLFMNPYDGR